MFNSFPIPKSDSGASLIKSIQRGSYVFEALTTKDIPISPINPDKSVVRSSIYQITSDPSRCMIAPTIPNATNLRLTRNGSIPLGRALYWEVIEFNNVRSKQTGVKTFSVADTEEDVIISPIVDTKSILFADITTSSATSSSDAVNFMSRIKNPTTLSFRGAGTTTVYWQLIEFF